MGWLIDQYEPGTQLEGGTASEIDRTLLVRSAVEFLAIKAGLRLNPMRLYSGSMAAAPELLKVVDLIMRRSQIDSKSSEADDEKQYRKLADIDVDDQVFGTLHFTNQNSVPYLADLVVNVFSIDKSAAAWTRTIDAADRNRRITVWFTWQRESEPGKAQLTSGSSNGVVECRANPARRAGGINDQNERRQKPTGWLVEGETSDVQQSRPEKGGLGAFETAPGYAAENSVRDFFDAVYLAFRSLS